MIHDQIPIISSLNRWDWLVAGAPSILIQPFLQQPSILESHRQGWEHLSGPFPGAQWKSMEHVGQNGDLLVGKMARKMVGKC